MNMIEGYDETLELLEHELKWFTTIFKLLNDETVEIICQDPKEIERFCQVASEIEEINDYGYFGDEEIAEKIENIYKLFKGL